MTGVSRAYLWLFSLAVLAAQSLAHAADRSFYEQYPFGLAYFYGVTGYDPLGSIVFGGGFHRWPEHIQSVEITYTVPEKNIFSRIFKPITNIFQITANITERNDQGRHILEFNPYFGGRWADFPWNCYINTTFAIGEGISYTTSIPSLEAKSSTETKRLLNYLMLEATFALPDEPRLQVLVRIHHRSGAYGLYHAGNTGSNDLGMGIRYWFD